MAFFIRVFLHQSILRVRVSHAKAHRTQQDTQSVRAVSRAVFVTFVQNGAAGHNPLFLQSAISGMAQRRRARGSTCATVIK